MTLIKRTLTQKQLDKELAYWQARLRLNDWLITAEVVPAERITLEGAEAQCSYLRSGKIARIMVLRPQDYESEIDVPHDMEWSLVHELLHLHISGVKDEEFEWSLYEEQVIDSIAHALVVTRREAAE